MIPSSSPYQHSDATTSRVMFQVSLALIPAVLLHFLNIGWGVITNIILILTFSLLLETLILTLRQRHPLIALSDGSTLVTALILGLALPPLVPWWLLLVAAITAVTFGKHLYGGLGYNPFNPAMLGYVVVLISFPVEMTQWMLPLAQQAVPLSLSESLQVVFSNRESLNALSGATPLDHLKTGIGLGRPITDLVHNAPQFGFLGSSGYEWVKIALLMGGLYLLFKGIIRWHIPVALLGSLAAIATLFYLIDSEQYASPMLHLFSGGAIFAAFFIATDPVTTATSPRGRVIFAIGVAVLIYTIRNWGGYPDGTAFAILLMNMAVPLIDHYTRPRIYGQRQANEP